jgi:hypothetical protein
MNPTLTLLIALLLAPLAASRANDNMIANKDTVLKRSDERTSLQEEIAWQAYLGHHDLVWDKLPFYGKNCKLGAYPREWDEGAFIGNGIQGIMIYRAGPQSLMFELGRTDVSDYWAKEKRFGFRLPIGKFYLDARSEIRELRMRLDLWNAEVRGEIVTAKGGITWVARAPRNADFMTVEIKTTGEEDGTLRFEADKGLVYDWNKKVNEERIPQDPVLTQHGRVHVNRQELVEEGDYAVGWTVQEHSPTHKTWLVAVAQNIPGTPEADSKGQVIATLKQALAGSADKTVADHRAWWHDYYARTFVSFSDPRWESFYWIQMYKYASAMRPDSVPLDNSGPWHSAGFWPMHWWNLEVQLTYSPLYIANRLDLARSLFGTVMRNKANLMGNSPVKGGASINRAGAFDMWGPRWAEHANLLWLLHNCYRHARSSMQTSLFVDDIFPILKAAVNDYLPDLKPDDSGVVHLTAKTHSPEFEGPDKTELLKTTNTSYDLAALKWGLATLVEINDRYSLHDESVANYRKILRKLTDYPTDDNGIMIGKEQSVDKGHRHYSHLLGIYPLNLFDLQNEASRQLATKSIDHWIDLTHPCPDITGYTYAAMSVFSSMLRRPEKALVYLDESIDKAWIRANSMFAHSKPITEAPSGCVDAIHSMLIQQHNGLITVFPAMPDRWKDAVFHNLLMEGGFLVSAKRQNGRTLFVRIESLAGEECVLEHGIEGALNYSGSKDCVVTPLAANRVRIAMPKGQAVLLKSAADAEDVSISPVAVDRSGHNWFGSKAAASGIYD